MLFRSQLPYESYEPHASCSLWPVYLVIYMEVHFVSCAGFKQYAFRLNEQSKKVKLSLYVIVSNFHVSPLVNLSYGLIVGVLL